MKQILLVVAIALTLAGCANTSGSAPIVGFSGFDRAKIVTINPHGNDCSTIICTGIGAQWNSSTPDSALLIVNVFNDITSISEAQLNIDGEIIKLKKSVTVTDMDIKTFGGVTTKESSKTFTTDISTIKKIISSKRTWLRVLTPTGYIEDRVIDGEKDSKAFHALKRFMLSVES